MRKNPKSWLIIFLLIILVIPSLTKKNKKKDNLVFDPVLNKVLKWRMIGPHRGGRSVAVAGHPTKREVFYFGGTGSGLWKTTDAGESWKNISDNFFKTSSVGAIAIAQSNPLVIYAGMGECCPRGNISHGDGVYKSINGGKTWVNIGLNETKHIARIVIDPLDENIIYVAALGHIFGPNPQRGLYKTTNGGKTWNKILFKGEKTGAIDLVMNPEDSSEVYVSFWQVQRYPWGFESGGKGSAVYKTTDGGETFNEISNNPGFPKGIKGRIGLTISAAKPESIWAIVEAEKKGLFKSEDSGKTWQLISSKADLFQRPWYYHHIKADPIDPNTLYVMNVGFWRSKDAGKSFQRIGVPHGDNHDLWIDAKDPNRMIEANDGGACVSFNAGKTWSSIYNQPTAQFYHVTTDNQYPYRIYGAQQDNSTISIPSRSDRGFITKDQWYDVGGCECGYIAVDPRDPNIVFAGCFDGMLTRYDHNLKTMKIVSVWPENPMGAGAEDLKYRFQWTFPIHLSLHDPNVLFTAANYLFRSTNQGQSWEKISPDLTRNDPAKLKSSGGKLTKDNTSVEYYCTIFSFAQSPVKKEVLWTGSDDGLIYLSKDNGKTWKDVTPKILPEWSLISVIQASHFDPQTAYVAATRYKLDDFKPYLLKTINYGSSWQLINNGIPHNDFTRVIRDYPKDKNILFAGTETGVYFSYNAGKNWYPFQFNLPVTPIHDIAVYNNDLILGTHGRSFWIMDNLNKLSELLVFKDKTSPYLFMPSKTVRTNGRYTKKPLNAGESLPVGVIFDYYIPKVLKEGILTLRIKDDKGEVVKTFSAEKNTGSTKRRTKKPTLKQGINRFVWDFNCKSSIEVTGAVFWFAPSKFSPKAVPGKYFVELEYAEKVLKREFEILSNPKLKLSKEDYQKQFDLLVKIRDKLSATHSAVNNIRSVRKQLVDFLKKIKGKEGEKALTKLADNIKKDVSGIEEELIQTKAKVTQDLLNYPIKLNNKLASLAMVVSLNESSPTKQSYQVYQSLKERVDIQLKRLDSIIKDKLVEFNQKVWEFKVPQIIIQKK